MENLLTLSERICRMRTDKPISEKWIKASVLGSTWAAFEIVLGSFLHNLKIPFSSNVLAGIGVIILVSSAYIWKERGLYWRAGLICALMKSISPSAVIFNPMIAIFSQALLLELSVTLLGKNVMGFVLGGMLALTWNFLQKIFNYIIFYGYNIVELYADILKYAQKQLNIDVDLVWSSILILLGIYSSIGVIAAIIGMRVGHRLRNQQNTKKNHATAPGKFVLKKREPFTKYSIAWLFLSAGMMIGTLVLVNFTHPLVWIPAVIVVVGIWISRYKRAFREFLRVKFWVTFVIITMLMAFVYSALQSQSWVAGALIGLQMNFKAAIIILGFSVLGTELYNPMVREFFARSSFHQLPLALELAFSSIPKMLAEIPEFKEVRKSPVSVISGVISGIELRLEDFRNKMKRRVYIITGPVNEGKTTLLKQLVDHLQKDRLRVYGFYAEKKLSGNRVIGYDLVDFFQGKIFPFLRKDMEGSYQRIGHYAIIPSGEDHGRKTLLQAAQAPCDLIVLDEVGLLELEGKGWAGNVSDLLRNSSADLLFVVRDIFLQKVIKKWGIRNCVVIDIKDKQATEVYEMMKPAVQVSS